MHTWSLNEAGWGQVLVCDQSREGSCGDPEHCGATMQRRRHTGLAILRHQAQSRPTTRFVSLPASYLPASCWCMEGL